MQTVLLSGNTKEKSHLEPSAIAACTARVIGGELEYINVLLKRENTSLLLAKNWLFNRLNTHLTFIPTEVSPHFKQVASEMKATLLGRSKSDADNEVLTELWKHYEKLLYSAYWKDRHKDFRVVEFCSHVTGVPREVLEEIVEIEKSLCIDLNNPNPQNGFLYAPSLEQLSETLSYPNTRLVSLSFKEKRCGFYIAHIDPQHLPEHVKKIMYLMHEKGFLPPETRASWSEICGISLGARTSMKQLGLNPYAALDDAILQGNQTEQVDVAFATVRFDNTAFLAHARRNWEDTGVIVIGGPNQDTPYKVLRRWIYKKPDSSSLPETRVNDLVFPDRVRPDHWDRNLLSHETIAYFASDVKSFPREIQDDYAINKCIEWSKEKLKGQKVVPLFCSDQFVIQCCDEYTLYNIRQLRARVDLWRCQIFCAEEVSGTLEEVLDKIGNNVTRGSYDSLRHPDLSYSYINSLDLQDF